MAASTEVKTMKTFQRLPKNVIPVHYDITVKPDLFKLVFEGSEDITLKVVEPVDEIVLNSYELELSGAGIVEECGKETSISQVDHDVENQKATFKLSHTLQPGLVHFKVNFKGVITDKLRGFYCSKYLNEAGEERYCALTQLEPTFARSTFPCWDEPAVKATFDVTLIVPKNRVALSNMPVISESPYIPDSNLHVVKFDRSPVMSTYLVAFVIGEFDYLEERSADGVLVRVYTPVGMKEQGRCALLVASKVLPYYKEYFGIEYPLPKMDLVAVPDHDSGAMENWGLLTFREIYLLVDDKNTSTKMRQIVAELVGHEIAHQWFGNLVTMEWWTHLWLKEGYADFVQALCVDYVFPEYKIWSQFVNGTFSIALYLDSMKTSHPIEVAIEHPDDIDEIYDDISYKKGASIIRMLHNYIGDDDFRRGMKLYLNRHRYSNTFTEDLWAALSEASSKPVGSVMSGWTKQMGFPVIHVTARQDGPDKRILKLDQERFLADGSKDESNPTWMIPVEISTSLSPTKSAHSFLLDGSTAEIVLNISTDEWLKINLGHVGFYRTSYCAESLQQLISAVQQRNLPALDRLGLVDDVFALAQAGYSSTVDALRLLEAFENEDDYNVWNKVCSSLEKLSQLLAYTPHHELLKAFGRRLLSRATRQVGWVYQPNEDHLTKLLRPLLLDKMVVFDDVEVIGEAEKRYGQEGIPADLRSTVYKAALRSGSRTKYDELLGIFSQASTPQEEKNRIASALGTSIKDQEIIKELLSYAVSNQVRKADGVLLISSVASTVLGRELAWKHLKSNVELYQKRFENSQWTLDRLVRNLTKNFASEDMAAEIENFFKEHHFAGTDKSVQQCVEAIRINTAWLKRDAEAIGRYLSAL